MAASRLSTIVLARSSENPLASNGAICSAAFIYGKEYIYPFSLSDITHKYTKEYK